MISDWFKNSKIESTWSTWYNYGIKLIVSKTSYFH
jgi:hypothetical protein